jgi:Asp-tRNA(Asn)/Glu-tRNA(Gln) amidotransferase A subunit family amidase
MAGLAVAASTSPATASAAFAVQQDRATLTLRQAGDLIRRREVSPVELVEACLSRIDAYDRMLNAYITVTRDQALAAAREVEVPAAGSVADIWNPEIYACHMPWITKSPELYQAATRALIQRAAETTSVVYAQARRHVDVVRRDIQGAFREVDLLITDAAQSRGSDCPGWTGGPGCRRSRSAADCRRPRRPARSRRRRWRSSQ